MVGGDHTLSENNQTVMNLDLEDTKALLQHVLKTVSERCKEEAEGTSKDIPLSNQDRILYFTGLTCDQVNDLISTQNCISETQSAEEVSTLSISDRILILNAVKCAYIQNLLPTYESIFENFTKSSNTVDKELLTDRNIFMKELKTLGFSSKLTIQNETVAMEDPEVRFERYMFLLKQKKIKSNPYWQDVVYVDERIVNSALKLQKPTQRELTINKYGLEETIFYHAVSVNGFITGIFMDQATEEEFTKWLSDIMLSHLKVPTVIILDNNPLHSFPKNTGSISRYNTKKEMIHWLLQNNISFGTNMSKPELYELITKFKDSQCVNQIDQIICSNGHTVLRLPRHFHDLSITTLFWENFKNMDQDINTNDINYYILNSIASVTPSTWADYEKCIAEYQAQLFDIDTVFETHCDAYEINK